MLTAVQADLRWPEKRLVTATGVSNSRMGRAEEGEVGRRRQSESVPAAVLSLRCGTAAPTMAALEQGCECAFPAAAAAVVVGSSGGIDGSNSLHESGQRVGSASGKAKAAFLLAVAELKRPGRDGGSLGRQSTGAPSWRENAKCRGGR